MFDTNHQTHVFPSKIISLVKGYTKQKYDMKKKMVVRLGLGPQSGDKIKLPL